MTLHWKNITLFLMIGWFLGAASGLVIMHFYHDRPMHRKHFEHMREHFSKELNMTPEQKTRMDAVLQTSRQKLDGIFSETEARVEDVRNATRAQIRQLLGPAQQATFDEHQAKWAAKNKKKRPDDMSDRF